MKHYCQGRGLGEDGRRAEGGGLREVREDQQDGPGPVVSQDPRGGALRQDQCRQVNIVSQENSEANSVISEGTTISGLFAVTKNGV